METYGLIAEALARGLEILGLDVRLNQRPIHSSPKVTAPCFVVPSEKEILVDGRKVVGSAQRRGERAFLQHGAVPLTIDYEELGRATGQAVFDPEAYRSAFAGVADFKAGLTADAVRPACATASKRSSRDHGPKPASRRTKRARRAGWSPSRYGSRAWNFRRGGEERVSLHADSAG